MSSARGKLQKAEKKAMHKRVNLRMQLYALKARIQIERENVDRNRSGLLKELHAKFDRLKADYNSLGGEEFKWDWRSNDPRN